MTEKIRLTRRGFVKGMLAAGAAVSAPIIVPSSVFGADGKVAPSNRITMGCIGVGGMGSGNLGSFLGNTDCQVLAVADVDAGHARNAKNSIDGRYKNADCATYRDFRELIARDDIDAISLATPDHWHAIVAIMAARAGKDIYGEKPLTHDLLEGRALCNAVKEHGRIWQTGSWQRSQGNFRFAAELVLNGRIGKVHTVEVGLPTGGTGGEKPFCEPPTGFDHDLWCGPSPWSPYSPDRTHWNWRWQLDYGGGQMMDWIGHHGDIAQWGLGTEETGPIEIEPNGATWPTKGIWDAPMTYKFTCKFKNGATMIVANAGNSGIRMGAKWIGADGWVWVDRGGFDTSPGELKTSKIAPSEINLFHSPGHHREFLDSIKTRRPTITRAEVAHRSASIGHLGMIALKVGRKIRWNPDTEQIIGDDVATGLLGRAKREPWHL